jgi:cytochrome c oxidase accessory protein FixG
MSAADKKPAAGTRQSDEQVQQSLYAKQQKIYPREVHGLYARLRTLGVLGLLGIYYITPWLRWDGHQAVLLDLPARKFHIFWLTFWPQDFIYLAFLLILAGLTLFFVTAIAGRIWCGYACPQTVWTEAFMWLERKIEGDRMKQQKLDAMPMNTRKLRIKATKHAAWLLFSAWTGFTFVGYFSPIIELGQNLLKFSIGPWELFWIIFYGFATYGNAGWMREQVCKYMCPYARFQSAMFDKDTLIISYDTLRGEPRGSRKRSADPQALGIGDCIDCTLCVQVCPTGIDIRDGLQYDCIACSACIDACDDVMDKMGYTKGLIRYTTENAMHGKQTHILRPRIVIYAVILAVIMAFFGYSISQRVALGLDVIRDRNRLFRETDEGLIENVYVLKILNMDAAGHSYELRVRGIPGLELYKDMAEIRVDSGEVLELPVRLRVDEGELETRSTEVVFELVATDNPELAAQENARFLGPR